MIWVVFAILTAAAAFSVLAPLARVRASAGLARTDADVAFYESEVASIARDVERGVIDEKEAEAARAEAARRLLATAAAGPAAAASGAGARRAAAIIAIGVVVLGGAALYLRIGAPNYPDQPLMARLNAPPEQMDMNAAIAKIEAHLAKNPDDVRGHEIVARVYTRIGRFAEAARHWSEAIRVSGPDPERATLLGEALTFANEGKVPPDAVKAFEVALAADPAFPQARFYLGLAAEQAGNVERAKDLWSKLLSESPPDAPWAPVVRERLAAIGGKVPVAAGSGVPQGEAAAAIAALAPAERDTAIRGMVDSLAARLADNGADAAGWQRLVRAYAVLQEHEKAKAALASARRALAGDSAALRGLQDLARELGLEG